MSTRKRERQLNQIHADLSELLRVTKDGNTQRTVFAAAAVRMQDARPALPGAQSYDGDRVTASVSGNPPRGFDQPDPTQHDRDHLDRILNRLEQDADTLVRLVAAWQPHEASAKDRTLTATNHREPLCEHCSKWVNDVEPVHRTSDCNGVLIAPMPLGRWCYDFCRTNGRLPSQNECERHDRGQQIRLPA